MVKKVGPEEVFGHPGVFEYGGIRFDLGAEGIDLDEQCRLLGVDLEGVVDYQLDADALTRLHTRGYLTHERVRDLRKRLMRRMVRR